MAISSLSHRKLRSALTIVGIVIGIAAVVSLLSTGTGATKFIEDQLGQFGANKIFIAAASGGGGFSAPTSVQQLTIHDKDEIAKVNGVDFAIGISFSSLPVKFNNENAVLAVIGIDPKDAKKGFSDIQGFQLSDGRFLLPGDKYSVDIGPAMATKTFSKSIGVGNKIDIDGVSFKVIGIMQSTGQQTNDNLIAIPIDTLRTMTGDTNHFSAMLVSVKDINKIDQTAQLIQKRLDDLHGKKVFSVLTTTQLVNNISAIFGSLTVLLTGIAAIALIVAAVGISNTMLMSVLERTKEIGIMKAVGATSWNIMEIFLMESAVTGLIGGVFGILLGAGVAEIINGASGIFGIPLKTYITPELAVGALVLAIGVGTIAGFYPARRAAKLHPIDALRYE